MEKVKKITLPANSIKMELKFTEIPGGRIAEVIAEDIVIRTAQDVLNIMADAGYHDARSIIVHRHQLTPDFFELRTGLAGEILQKFSNYRMRLAIIGDFSNESSKSLRDFIYESNKAGRIVFTENTKTAVERFS